MMISQCRVFDTQVTVKACEPLVFIFKYPATCTNTKIVALIVDVKRYDGVYGKSPDVSYLSF